jgi:RNA polymerase sigma-70 factor (ECF subfamily)
MDYAEEDPGARLMVAWQAGEEAAFDRLVESYSGRVWGLCTRFLGDVSGREDLVQEVFLRVVRARDRYQPSARFSTWLYRIVFNLCANWRQRRREAFSLEGPTRGPAGDEEGRFELADEGSIDPSDGLVQDDVVAAVRRAIAELPENQRMALILAKYEDMSHAEIANVMSSSEKAVKSLVHRARESLRGKLAPFFEEELR